MNYDQILTNQNKKFLNKIKNAASRKNEKIKSGYIFV
jgi:hypothetical protein